MYYSVSKFRSNTSAIGLAGSTTGQPGSWADYGIVYTSNGASDYNAIDPNLFVDSDGKWWLSFGSWWTGIKMIQINPSTGKQLAGNTTRYSLASRPTGTKAVEAPYVVKRNGYYYLFASYDTCCAGTSSTYKVKVGRATSVTGPYYDRNGVAMTNNGGTPVLETHGNVIGPGGQSIMKDTDGDLIVYHYYDGADNGTPKLGINLLNWSSGWPVAPDPGAGTVRRVTTANDPNQPVRTAPAAPGQPVAGAAVSPSVPRTCAAVSPPRAGTPGGVGNGIPASTPEAAANPATPPPFVSLTSRSTAAVPEL
ncbi:hypothetical protein SFUMM280S_01007 [Streptomyces fumanus]